MEKPTIKRREREREARREAILDAAARVFSRKSFHEATLDEIAVEAELAKGTLYNYYRDKQDIFASLMSRGHHDFQERLIEVANRGGTLAEMLHRIFGMALKILIDNRYMFRMVVTAGDQLSDSFRNRIIQDWQDHVRQDAEILAEAFAQMPETSRLPERDRLTGAYLILSAIGSLHQREMAAVEEQSWGNEIENYTRLLCRALSTEHTS